MTSKIKVCFTGPTGYIGGSVLDRFLKRSDLASYDVRVITRSSEKAAKFKTFGVETVVCSNDDLATIEQVVSESDIFFSLSQSDNVAFIEAVLRGAKRYHATTGIPQTLIHTSGMGILVDTAKGMYTSEKVYEDTNADEIEALPTTNPHRPVDIILVAADKEGYVKTYFVIPPLVYGFASGRFIEAGIQKSLNTGAMFATLASLSRKPPRAGKVGKGVCIWTYVHVDDLVDLYTVLFDAIKQNPQDVGHGREGFYFADNGEIVLGEISKRIGQVMFELGKTTDPEPSALDASESATVPEVLMNVMYTYLGSNARITGKRSRSIGWKPVHPAEEFLESINAEAEYTIKNGV